MYNTHCDSSSTAKLLLSNTFATIICLPLTTTIALLFVTSPFQDKIISFSFYSKRNCKEFIGAKFQTNLLLKPIEK
jgi:hypothetical protein